MPPARFNSTRITPVRWTRRLGCLLALVAMTLAAHGQIDPEKRRLIEAAGEFPLHGRGPLAAYFYYYHNEPEFLGTNMALRLVIAPVYLVSELGFRHALGEYTDLGIGLAGGGFANSYSEIRGGDYERAESFIGHGGEISTSVYHLFNPADRAPLNGILRASIRTAFYDRDSKTAPNFEIPTDQTQFVIRTGLRLGGREPSLSPELAAELSVWYEGKIRFQPEKYGFNHDREINPDAHLFWARALLAYTFPDWRTHVEASVTAGTSIDADRLSAPRLGGNLPLVAEFPLSLPGYYAQELSARHYALFSGRFTLPLAAGNRLAFAFFGSAGWVDYIEGLDQPGHFQSGLGGGLVYRSASNALQLGAGYGYGFQALRDRGRGAQTIAFVAQYDFEAARRVGEPFWRPLLSPDTWRSVFRIFGAH